MMNKAKALIYIVDLVLLNALIFLSGHLGCEQDFTRMRWMINVFYIISVLLLPPFAHGRFVRVEQILTNTIKTTLLIFFLLFLCLDETRTACFQPLIFFGCFFFSTIVLFYGRYFAKQLLRYVRNHNKNYVSAVFVGAGVNLEYLYNKMCSDLSTGYRIIGYFDDTPSENLHWRLQCLGTVTELLPWLEGHRVHQLYCNLPTTLSYEIKEIIKYCEKNFVHFYSVPNVHNYVHRSMVVNMIDDMPVLTIRKEPLSDGLNRLVKRTFDILISSLFLVTCFWWITVIVAIITKITMPGPVFFIQKRNGIMGKEFYCIKFRSMRVNEDADKLQASKNDPRKTKWGNIMRKTSLDELPQFINVFLGDMSIVGPRPHMIKHTQDYSALIEKYMVRHWVKPGITGWAQTHGARGETEHLWQMEDRIKKDVWYIENWSLPLDVRIIYLTIRKAFAGDKQAY